MPSRRPAPIALMALLTAANLLGACAQRGFVYSSPEARAADRAQVHQQVADDYRRASAPDAAKQAQVRANETAARARNEPNDFWCQVLTGLLGAWWEAGRSKPPSMPPR